MTERNTNDSSTSQHIAAWARSRRLGGTKRSSLGGASALFAAPLIALAAASCGGGSPEAATGQLTVSWLIGGSTCAGSGLATVEVTLVDARGPVDAGSAACQVGNYVFRIVPEGQYRIEVDGFPAEDAIATYSGLVETVVVKANFPNAAPAVALTQNPGGIDAIWFFDNGQLCSFNGVDTVELSLWNPTTGVLVAALDYPCDLSKRTADPTAAVPNPIPAYPARGALIAKVYAGTYTLWARGKGTASAAALVWAEKTVVVKQARVEEVMLELKNCAEKPNNSLCGI